ncbi:MAG: hypothetical protein IJ511_01455 [Bacteroides sp.]|nr:hypothetical protein [Bacteroides sp.]
MKQLNYIATLLIALLILLSGSAFSFSYNCCRRCEATASCCHALSESVGNCRHEGCKDDTCMPTASFQKECCANGCIYLAYTPEVALQKSTLSTDKITVIPVPFAHACFSFSALGTGHDNTLSFSPQPPPLPVSKRLALYATLLI